MRDVPRYYNKAKLKKMLHEVLYPFQCDVDPGVAEPNKLKLSLSIKILIINDLGS